MTYFITKNTIITSFRKDLSGGNNFLRGEADSLQFSYLTVQITCQEHYTYTTTRTSTDSEGRTTTHTEYVLYFIFCHFHC
jgi:hypothetical protein